MREMIRARLKTVGFDNESVRVVVGDNDGCHAGYQHAPALETVGFDYEPR